MPKDNKDKIVKDILKKFRKYAKDNELTLRIVSRESISKKIDYAIAYYEYDSRKICLSKTLVDTKNIDELIYTLAHEFGHAADFDNLTKTQLARMINATKLFQFARQFDCAAPKYLKDMIILREKQANAYGRTILKELCIDIKKSVLNYYDKESIRSYRDLISSTGKK